MPCLLLTSLLLLFQSDLIAGFGFVEEILPFTNVAASIVHDAVTENGGQPNRNLGDAFLCVWKPKLETQVTLTMPTPIPIPMPIPIPVPIPSPDTRTVAIVHDTSIRNTGTGTEATSIA